MLCKQLDKDLIMDLDTNGDGLDKVEFVVGMLTKLELIKMEHVQVQKLISKSSQIQDQLMDSDDLRHQCETTASKNSPNNSIK